MWSFRDPNECSGCDVNTCCVFINCNKAFNEFLQSRVAVLLCSLGCVLTVGDLCACSFQSCIQPCVAIIIVLCCLSSMMWPYISVSSVVFAKQMRNIFSYVADLPTSITNTLVPKRFSTMEYQTKCCFPYNHIWNNNSIQCIRIPGFSS